VYRNNLQWASRNAREQYTSYITLQTIYSGLSKSNFKDHYGDAATQQCLGMIAEIDEFSVSDEMLWEMGQTGHR